MNDTLNQERLDGFINTYTGINVKSRDVLTRAYFSKNTAIPKEELDAFYEQNGIASKIIDTIVDDGLYKMWTVEKLSIEDDEENNKNKSEKINKIDKRMSSLGIYNLVDNAVKRARLHGGSALFIGAIDGKPLEEPLDIKNVNDISFLTLFEKDEISVSKYYDETNIDKFGKPELFSVMGGVSANARAGTLVHESRIIPFYGVMSSKKTISENNGFGVSVLEKAYEAIRDYEQIIRSIYYLIDRSNQPVFRVEKLFELLSQEEGSSTQKFLKRMQWVNMAKSQLNAIVLDTTESFEYASVNVGGLENVIDRIAYRISVAADMPLTLLFGTSPDGMNNTGQSDKINWNKKVDAYRVHHIQPQLERIVQLIASEQGASDYESYYITWPSLVDTTPEQDAAFKNAVIDRDLKCISAGIATPEEVAQTRLVENNWTGDIMIDLEIRKMVDESDNDEQQDNDVDEASMKVNDQTKDQVASEKRQSEESNQSNKAKMQNNNEQLTMLNGAQAESMINVIKSVANREISRSAGVQIISSILGVPIDAADKKMADVGLTFFSDKEVNEPVQ